MKTRIVKLGVIALLSTVMPFTTKAQDKVEASVGADIVSGYIWRGQDLGGVSLQPSASIAYKGFSLEAWGSVGIEKTNADGYDAKELDLILGYSPVVSAYLSPITGSTPVQATSTMAPTTPPICTKPSGYDFARWQ
mgnify:CR=1 FL=1